MYIYIYIYIYIYPPTSPEHRACETRYHQSTYCHIVRHPRAIKASSSNSARPSSSRLPGNLGNKATAQADSCLQQPRQDAANLITYLLIGATGIRHRLPQAAKVLPLPLQQPGQDPTNLTTGDFRLPDPEPPSSPTKHSTQRSAAEAAAFKYIYIYIYVVFL